MRAVRLRTPDGAAGLVLEELDTPAPGAGEVLVRVHAAEITRDELDWPVDRLRLREDMLTLLRRGGLDDADAVSTVFALFAYATGFVAFETARVPRKRDTEQRAQGYRVHSTLPEEAFPSTRALARRLAKRLGEREFTRGLRGVLAGFANN
jgi:Tetracyclin repressor-like, C-terminal domain